MRNALTKEVANREEVHPPGARPARTVGGVDVEDVPLVLFTLLGQAAAGLAFVSPFAHLPDVPLLATIGVLTSLAALASLLHLGTVSQGWRAPANARSSALSREIVALGLFAAAWLAAWFNPAAGRAALAACGVVLVYAMADVYTIDGIAGWNSWRTRAAFVTSASLLGIVATLAIGRLVSPWFAASTGAVLFADQFARRRRFYGARHARVM
jgi:DMSO reductase anchor subunit